ncbi:putative 3-ketosteroid-9-alpha-monooxygenase, oxygenase component [BD1-7 clade bacterium]|uniref:Putative 3-ketosteroid-9-alpha-monooxygenase, oxygenase component n=1 Tax=BD1-7 clade bacterium TaxID=2029982 RepID=A0A5S9Q1K8_9GAMM|nr:putative 3-ketosteroid-9-alpha-monooxygenase, oxygenase component [BD1-7 clade bacterium]CAA0112537.1 putative 3-ketosteroid-9-alpha-monooxygenase, oxygenase component [BD1-7 clade bacterium]
MTTEPKAKSADYGLGPHTYPRGWFVVAEANELDNGPIGAEFFGKEFVLYRGNSGKVIALDAYCKHMGTHLAKSTSAHIVTSNSQIVGDSILCPYHAWQYGADGALENIPYDDICPKNGSINAYEVREVMGCIMMWHDEEGQGPDYEPPYLPAWDADNTIPWVLDHLGEIGMHNLEILDNICDVRHLGPTHGSPCEYFENEFRDFQVLQRQGGYLDLYQAHLDTVTWYTGPGILLSKQTFNGITMFEFIAGTPVRDGVTKAWHGALCYSANVPPTEEDVQVARELQAGVLEAFATDFEVWANKVPALKVIQTPKDGNFRTVRRWANQFYMPREDAGKLQEELNGVLPVKDFPQPSTEARDEGFEDDCFKLMGQDVAETA